MKILIRVVTLLLGSALLMVSCQSNTTQVAPNLTPEIQEALNAAILDEYKAQMTYQKVLDDFGSSTRPFSNILNAEVKHANAIADLLITYQRSVPANPYNLAQMPVYSSVQAACQAGAEAEIENIELYDRLLAQNLPTDVRKVFENNRSASLNNHLPAFNACK